MAQLENIEAIEKRLWGAADTLRANSNYASNEYFMPVMGLIFLRHAYSRFLAVKDDIIAGLPTRGGVTRSLTKEDFSQKGAILLREAAQFDNLVNLSDSDDRPKAVINAMESIEDDYDTLKGVLPKSEYNELDNEVLGQLLRALNPEELKKVSGDVFGRIYEYFLTQFADQKAHDGGEFFTPVSLVSFIAQVLEPERGIVLDPACGSGGMFVQSARFVEHMRRNPSEQLTFMGMEKNPTTIRLAKMNLAVHGLEGNIQKAISYYEDPHELYGKVDYVMANPPFNVDEVDAEKVKRDPRLPFGLPGVNKKGKVSNGNYLWISYFYSYLNEHGKAGFVMSSQASSAGNDEAKVRKALIETGDVDAMVAIRSNFFYTRSVPCELWFIDRGKPDQPSPPAPLPEVEGSNGRTDATHCSSSRGRSGDEGSATHYRGGFDYAGLVKRARELRRNQTSAEDLFWELVRNRSFCGLKFRRQHQIGDYITDFYCHELKTVIELDGAVHENRKDKDVKRDAYLESQGIKVIRIANETLLNKTEECLKNIAINLPSTFGRGGGGEGKFSGGLNSKGKVLMIDARNIYRKVTRKIYDFSPEQLQNLLSIVWLYRGEQERFINLVQSYLEQTVTEAQSCVEYEREDSSVVRPLDEFTGTVRKLLDTMQPFLSSQSSDGAHSETQKQLTDALNMFDSDTDTFAKLAEIEVANLAASDLVCTVDELAKLADSSRDLVKDADMLYKLASHLFEAVCKAPSPPSPLPKVEGSNARTDQPSRTLSKVEGNKMNLKNLRNALKDADGARKNAVEQLKQVRYFWKQAHWLVERFPDAKFADVEGLVKLVDHSELEANDWSLTPGRYVGVAPEVEDEDFDFEETMREIHAELAELNAQSVELAAKIAKNFEELGI